ncbi:hypothetical protein ACX801_18045 [Arthrobacter bambusae]
MPGNPDATAHAADNERPASGLRRPTPYALNTLRFLSGLCIVFFIAVFVALIGLSSAFLALEAALRHGLEKKTADILGDGIEDVMQQFLPAFLVLALGYVALILARDLLDSKGLAASEEPIRGSTDADVAFYPPGSGKAGFLGAPYPTSAPNDTKGEPRD